MQTLIKVKTPTWDLAVKSNHTESRYRQLKQALTARGKDIPVSSVKILSEQAGEFSVFCNNMESLAHGSQKLDASFLLSHPMLFENSTYGFEFSFKANAHKFPPRITHDLKSVSESFNHSMFGDTHVLWGTLNTGNSLGWLKLPLNYQLPGQPAQTDTVSFEVFPTKMDMRDDLTSIVKQLQHPYRDWCFTLTEKTSHDAQNNTERSHFPVMWLNHFEHLRNQFYDGIKRISHSPHARLLNSTKHLKADRLKGKLSAKLEQQVKESLAQKRYYKRYAVEQKTLKVDTPENRFIKFAIQTLVAKLKQVSLDAELVDPEKEILSAHFFNKLEMWCEPLNKALNAPFFKEVGRFRGLNTDSLVLQQKSGYAKVYRAWQELKLYLDLFGVDASVSVRSIADLYEVWCYLQVTQIVEELGFEKVSDTEQPKLKRKGLKVEFEDGLSSSQSFKKGDVSIRVAHEPRISLQSDPYKAWTSMQKPDIFLEVSIGDRERLVWVFDAKYRIDSTVPDKDCIPTDALNQMHRYRDALIYLKSDSLGTNRTRPVFGAFALYPGFYAQTSEDISANPYWDAINEVGVGAFPLLPGASNESGNAWLKAFLTDQLANLLEAESERDIDRYFFQESARISQTGLKSIRHSDLALITSTAADPRKPGYYESFLNGSAKVFHMKKKASTRKYIIDHKIREMQFIVIAAPDIEQGSKLKANYVWHVESVDEVSGHNLTAEITGTPSKKRDEKYWLFKLSQPQALTSPPTDFDQEHHNFKFQPLSELI